MINNFVNLWKKPEKASFLGMSLKTHITMLSQNFCTNLLERLDKNIFICLYVIIVLYKKRKVKEKVMSNLCKRVIAGVLALAMIASGIIISQSESADVKAADE